MNIHIDLFIVTKKYMNIHIDLFVVTVKKMNIYIEENTMVLTR